jgi:FdhD protein
VQQLIFLAQPKQPKIFGQRLQRMAEPHVSQQIASVWQFKSGLGPLGPSGERRLAVHFVRRNDVLWCAVILSYSPERRVREVTLHRVNGGAGAQGIDYLAAEEPLEIRIEGHSVAVVMRTPGEDCELAAGFLVTEGLVRAAREVLDIRHRPHCLSSSPEGNGQRKARQAPVVNRGTSAIGAGAGGRPSDGNRIEVRLKRPTSLDLKRLTRHLFSSSSCGICSKASIEAVRQQFPPIKDNFEIDPPVLLGLPAALATAQETFKRTGGLHACALFDLAGHLRVLREDIGRHNALDKVVGWAMLQNRLPLHRHILLLSGRASFEMIQKALAAGIPIVAAISAPSSLAVELAVESGQTLVGFLRGERMNIYAGACRLSGQAAAAHSATGFSEPLIHANKR